MLGVVLFILLNDVFRLVGGLDVVGGMRGSHSIFHYERIR